MTLFNVSGLIWNSDFLGLRIEFDKTEIYYFNLLALIFI